MIEGDMTPRALTLVLEWVNIHKDELNEMWETQTFRKLPPLE